MSKEVDIGFEGDNSARDRDLQDLGSFEEKFDAKIIENPHIVRGNALISYLQVPIETLVDENGDLPFPEYDPEKYKPNAEIRLLNTPEGRNITFTVPPQDDKKQPSIWAVNFFANGEVLAEHGYGYEPREVVPVFDKLKNAVVITIEKSTPRQRSIRDFKEATRRRLEKVWKNSNERKKGERSIEIAFEHHKEQFRKSGEPYIDHPWDVARVISDDFGITDPVLMNAAWIHDVPEDSPEIQQPEVDLKTGIAPKKYSVWRKEVERWLSVRVGSEAAKLGMILTRPKPDGIEIKSSEEAEELYLKALAKSPRAILVKMSDRLHNVRTLEIMPPENQRNTLISTLTDYEKLFAKVRKRYPKAYAYYQVEKEKALRPVAERLGIDYDALVKSNKIANKRSWGVIFKGNV